jgi:N-acetylglucosaminyldiphosphoundecaprenol N-acetyl-beta-D-mannosaminyltransferase
LTKFIKQLNHLFINNNSNNNLIVSVLNINIYVGDINSFTKELIEDSLSDKARNRLVGARDAHGLIYATKNLAYKKLLNEFYYNLPDGLPIVWVGRIKGFNKIKRCAGLDTFINIISQTAQTSISHFFCGGKPGIADQLNLKVIKKLANKNVVGTYSPPFRSMTDEEFADLGKNITNSGAKIIWIGLGSPKQEIFAAKLAEYINVNYIITVGAVFDFYTGNIMRAPTWIQNLGLEWLYRIIKEPRRLFIRYAEVVPKFIWFNIKELLSLN